MFRDLKLSKRSFMAGACGLSLALSRIAHAKPGSLVVATTGGKLTDAIKAAYIQPFTAATGIGIVDAASVPAKLKAMVDAGAVEWDVVQLDAATAASLARLRLLESIDYSIIDRSKFLPGTARDSYLVSDVAGSVIAWNTKSVEARNAPATWADVWDLRRIRGRRGLFKQPSQTFELALMADGVAPVNLYPIDIDRALHSLDRIKPQISWWVSGAQSAQFLIDGEVSTGMSWNGRLLEPKQGGAPIDFVFEQTLFTSDAWVVPKGAKNVKESMEFIAFATRADRQAAFSDVIPYGPVRADAMTLVSAKRQLDLPSAPANLGKGVFQEFDWWAEYGDAAGSKFNAWLLG